MVITYYNRVLHGTTHAHIMLQSSSTWMLCQRLLGCFQSFDIGREKQLRSHHSSFQNQHKKFPYRAQSCQQILQQCFGFFSNGNFS